MTGDTPTLLGGTLPTGISFTSGQLSGTPSAAGSYSLTIEAWDYNGSFRSQSYTLTVDKVAPTLNWATPATIP